jgi:hypothetical protein
MGKDLFAGGAGEADTATQSGGITVSIVVICGFIVRQLTDIPQFLTPDHDLTDYACITPMILEFAYVHFSNGY